MDIKKELETLYNQVKNDNDKWHIAFSCLRELRQIEILEKYPPKPESKD